MNTEHARGWAKAEALNNASFDVMNAEQMDFEDSTFDLIFGSGIIHHLNIEKAYSEIARVLKPGGSAIFVEPLGHNPFINAFRRKTPELRTPDEHPLLKNDCQFARNYFDHVDIKFYGLTTLWAIPVIKTGIAKPLITFGKITDKLLLKVPGLKWWAWYCLLTFSRNDNSH